MPKKIQVIFHKAGMLTTVQDIGRQGHQSFGVPVGGAMDRSSAQLANHLVGNDDEQPVLEITLLGPRIEFSDDCQIAITGADLSPKINNAPIAINQTIRIQKEDILSFGKIKNGCRSYLAIGGKWKIEKWLGSTSTFDAQVTPNSIIKKGSIIQIEQQVLIQEKKVTIDINNQQYIRVVAGPEFKRFSQHEINHFLNQKHIISNESNRMGYRLKKSSFQEKEREIISSGIIPGTIQVTTSGQAIILMRDAQTTGGYFRFLNVIKEDINLLAQKKPGDSIYFRMK